MIINFPSVSDPDPRSLARVVLFSFLLTFISSRILVFAIMSRWIPDLYMHLGGTHIHHLNLGIFLLSAAGSAMLFARPSGRALYTWAVIYAVGLALTFDEFGMWVHLGGGYWQRASWDAIVVIATVLALLAYMPPRKERRGTHWAAILATVILVTIFFFLLNKSFNYVQHKAGPRFHQLETEGPV